MYAIPGEWISWAAPLRLALVTSVLAAVWMVTARIGRGEPLFVDGLRGWSLAGFIILSIASVKWSVNPEATQVHSVDLLKMSAIYFTMVNVITTPRRLYLFSAAIVLSSAVTSIGVIQWYIKGVDLVEGFRARWLGIYGDPNHMAMNIGIIVPLAASFIVRRETGKWLKIFCIAAAALAVTAMVLSFSRGGFIGLMVAMAFWTFREKGRRLAAVGAGLLLIVGMAIFAPSTFWTRNETVASIHLDESAMGRVYAWEVAAAINKDKPFFGVGGGGFRYAWPLYQPQGSHRAYVAHNVYLDVLGETGFIGFFLYLLFTSGAVAGAFRAAKDEEIGWLGRGISSAVVAYLLCAAFSGYVVSAHFFVLFAMAACSERVLRAQRAAAPVRAAQRVRAPPAWVAPS
jgi:O-antigen ligase